MSTRKKIGIFVAAIVLLLAMALVGCGKTTKTTTSTGTTTGTTSEHTHTLVYHEAVAATCLADGNVKYYVCSSCGTYFADEEGSEETTLSAVAGASATIRKTSNGEYRLTEGEEGR